MATNKSSSAEDAELVDQIEAKAEDSLNDVSEHATEAGEQLDELAEQAEDALHEDEPADLPEGQDSEPVEYDDPVDEEPAEDGREETANEADEQEIHYEEERRGSFAGRVLWLLLFLIAGGAAALWGGPKLAPMLPAPLAPLAKYLTPGGDQVGAEVSALRTDVESRFSELPAPIAQETIDTAISTAVSDATAQTESKFQTALGDVQATVDEKTEALSAQIAALSDKVTASDSGAIEARLNSLETQISGMSAEFAALQQSLGELKDTAGTGDDGSVAEMSADVAAKIAAYAASLEGMKAEIASLASQNGEISQKIDEVEAATNRQISESNARVASQIEESDARAAALVSAATERAEQSEEVAQTAQEIAAIEAAMRNVRAKLDSGEVFSDELSAVMDVAQVEVPDILTSYAESGVPSAALLAGEFSDAANAAIRSSIKADAEAGTVSGFSAFLKSQVVTRSLTPQDGDSTDAVLSRMDAGLESGDLTTVLEEATALPEAASSAMADWLTKARSRAEALSGFDALNAALAARN